MPADITFVAPRLPDPPKQYQKGFLDRFNNTLRLYFNQLDDGIRKAATSPEAQAQAWFLG
jgi:hypothetical protein|tara:strand:- start:679 stop:858 length:180 start_codon:yes stop_codon:yes gene_type:complete